MWTFDTPYINANCSLDNPINGLFPLSVNLMFFSNPISLDNNGKFHPPIPVVSVGSPQCISKQILSAIYGSKLSRNFLYAVNNLGCCFLKVFLPIVENIKSYFCRDKLFFAFSI